MRPRFVIAAAGAAATLAAAGAIALFVLLPAVRYASDFEAGLAAVDRSIAEGSFPTARVQLQGFRVLPRGGSDRMRLLKRAFVVGRNTGDFGILSDLSRRMLEAGGQDRGARLAAGYALLRTGKPAEAARTLAGAVPGGKAETAGLLRAEAALRLGTTWQGAGGAARDILALESSRNPADFEAAAQSTGEKQLALDAALLSMEAGNPGRASLVARSALQDAAFDEPAAFIAYDAGDFEEAVRRLGRLQARLQARRAARADIALVLADSYDALGRTADAEAALRQAVALDPRVSWTPYASLGALLASRGDAAGALDFLGKGRSLFPSSAELVLESAQVEAGRGDTPAALALLDRLVQVRPEDSAAALFRLSLRAPQLSPEGYRAELWKLFNRIPADDAAFTTLLSSLIAAHDWDGAETALRQHGLAAGGADGPRAELLRGVLAAMKGQLPQAAEALTRAADAARSGAARYDLAVVLLYQGSTADALAQLQAAHGEAGTVADPSARAALLTRIEVLKGRALLKAGDVSAARAAFLRALVSGPHDLRAALELRKLEAGEQQ